MTQASSAAAFSAVKGNVKALLTTAKLLRQGAVNSWNTQRWRILGTRPKLNADRAERHIADRLPAKSPAVTDTGGRIHVRIAFHYVPHRLMYLLETMTAVAALPFEEIDIWVDTNSEELIPEIRRWPFPHNVKVWKNLDHPFKLTWMHRGAMLQHLDDFEAFCYVEDDILIPRRSMQMWLRETPRLQPLGLLPGFVRIEEGRDGTLYLSDYPKRLSRECIKEIDGRPYLSTPYPYQACWVYDQTQMRELTRTKNYLTGAIDGMDPGMREQVAFGLQFTAVPEGYASRAVIPLTDDLEVSPDALIFHAPCNYANLRPPHPWGLGQVPLSELFST
jgi:hypothetical protein